MKIKKYIIGLFGFAVLSQLFFGCVPAKPVKKKAVFTSTRLIKKIEANRRKVKTFSASGVLKIESPEFSGKGNFEVLLKRPDSIRVSIYGPFGIDLAQILVTDSKYIYYDVIKNRVYKGANRKGILKSIFKIDLSFDDLIDAFAGSINLSNKLLQEPDSFEQNDEYYIFTYLDKATKLKSVYRIRISDLAIENYKIFDKGNNLLFEGKYRNFKLFHNVAIPYKLLIENNNKNQKIALDYRKIRVNKNIPNLSIELPNDAKIIKW